VSDSSLSCEERENGMNRCDVARRLRSMVLGGAVLAALAVVLPAGPAYANTDRLGADGQLTAGQSLVSTDGAYQVIMQGDGNLVEYFEGRALWNTGTQGHPGASTVLQGDGNLVVYGPTGALWNSGTQGHPGAVLILQNDANLVVYDSAGARWANYAYNDRLIGGQTLDVGQHLQAASGGYTLHMQGDGNLVEYTPGGTALWTSGTEGHPGAYALMQPDGNLVVYASGGTALWNTGTYGNSGAWVAVQSDANLVVYTSGGAALWQRPRPGGPIGDDYPYKNGPADVVDPWNFYTRECTSFVAWRMNHQYGIGFTNGMRGGHWGNANQWPANARSLGYAVNGTATVGAIAEFNTGQNGHVALVAQVNSNGTITVEEYNFGTPFGYGVRTIPISSVSAFIHVAA
jgi:surface antigen